MKINKKKQQKGEEEVKKKCRKWLKEQHPHDWFIFPATAQVSLTPRKQRMLSPDIDILAYYKDSNGSDKLIAFEVKAPIERYKRGYREFNENSKEIGFLLYKTNDIVRCQKEGKIKTSKAKAGLAFYLIYQGIGEALFNLRWADQSYLVLPRLFSFYTVDWEQEVFPYILYENLLPLGLIEYEWRFESKDETKIGKFKQTYPAKDSYLWQKPSTGRFNQESNQLLYRDEILLLRDNLIKRCLRKKVEK